MNTVLDSTVNFNSDIQAASEGRVAHHRNAKSFFLAIAVLLAGVALIVVAGGMEDQTTSAYIASLVFGISGVLVGALLLFFGGKQLTYLPSKSKIKVESYFFEPNQLYTIAEAVKGGDYTKLKSLKQLDNSGIRLDVLASADRQFAAAQVYQYVPYSYTPASPLYCAYEDNAQELIRVFAR